jgi:surfeit locus 1 family protein
VPLRIAHRRFAPSLFATLLTLVGIVAFVRLGMWQMHRADEKRALEAHYVAGTQSTVELSAANAGTLPAFQHVHVAGHYDPAHQILLDNMPSQHGQPGYRVVTPFRSVRGEWLLVDRGWIAPGATRNDLPDVSFDAKIEEVSGRFDALPRAGIALASPPATPDAPWPRVMNFPQHAALEQALDRPILPGLILLDPDQPSGFERVWQAHFNFGPQRHIAYAVQWFAFAAVAFIIYLIVSFRRESADVPTERSR